MSLGNKEIYSINLFYFQQNGNYLIILSFSVQIVLINHALKLKY